ncbi:MAG TPA: rhamnulokinase family protein [Chthoniobacteraceae bacterium]|jgi:rhamnulokinase|nr:rhamnulokinase family protein [Chthoniobacteraceae bacterium]
MSSPQYYIACDLGAESGRVMLGALEDGRLELSEIHRFTNSPARILGTYRWDTLRIFEELKRGLRKIAERGISARSVSVDSWGVDYVLTRGKEPQLGLPYNYRDARTDSTFEVALKKATATRIYGETGIQFMSINTLYQFVADLESQPETVALADKFLLIGDYFNYLFSGRGVAEESLASTTQIYNPRTRAWSSDLIDLFGFNKKIFPEIVPSGTVLGPVLPEIVEETRLRDVQVVATCSHDTGAAVAAVPADGDDWAFLSSGTWSLIGVELPQPLINEAVRSANFTNEAGFGGTTRLLKNISGLWLLQECRRAWASEGTEYGYEELTHLALETEPLRSLVNPDEQKLGKPGQMPRKIQEACEASGHPAPSTPGQIVRCILESLALTYRTAFEQLRQLTGRELTRLHIVGGGSQSKLLNQASADAIGCTVIAGPVEATAIGNVLVQAIALKDIESLAALRRTVRESFPVTFFKPRHDQGWEEAYQRFRALH